MHRTHTQMNTCTEEHTHRRTCEHKNTGTEHEHRRTYMQKEHMHRRTQAQNMDRRTLTQKSTSRRTHMQKNTCREKLSDPRDETIKKNLDLCVSCFLLCHSNLLLPFYRAEAEQDKYN